MAGGCKKKEEAVVEKPTADIVDYTNNLQNSLQKAEKAAAIANKTIKQGQDSAAEGE